MSLMIANRTIDLNVQKIKEKSKGQSITRFLSCMHAY